MATKQEAETAESHRRFVESEVADKIESLTEFIDADDVVGNKLMAYLVANADDIADILADESSITGHRPSACAG